MSNIYLIPKQDKTIKIVYDELPCPMNSSIRCENAKSRVEENYVIYCSDCTSCPHLSDKNN